MDAESNKADGDLHLLKHDIRNQLSNINLALEQLKYEIPDGSADCAFYLEMIAASCKKINSLINDAG